MSSSWSSSLCIVFTTFLVIYLSAKFFYKPVISEIEQITMAPDESNETESKSKNGGHKEKLPKAEGDCESCWGDEYDEEEVTMRRCAQCKNQILLRTFSRLFFLT